MSSLASVGQVSFIFEKNWIIIGFIDYFGLFHSMYMRKLGDK